MIVLVPVEFEEDRIFVTVDRHTDRQQSLDASPVMEAR
jgi:hypothetical protein